MNAVPAFFTEHGPRIEAELKRLVPSGPGRVQEAMAYTVHAPSKRVRAVLTIACNELCGGRAQRALPAAAAIELVHASSLILDDLPAMDDAPLRRGRPANHLVFGEAIAILAAFALLNLSYDVLARGYEPLLAAALTTKLAAAIGLDGLVGGQAIDLLATDQQISFETLEQIHRGKTGALFVASAEAGALSAGAIQEQQQWLVAFAKNLGGGPRGHQEDNVRVLQRRRRRAGPRRGAVRDRQPRACAVRTPRRSPA
jgi:geranylgeranyl diphosphate synthase type II